MLELNLGREGYEVVSVSDGQAALDALTNESFDFALCDLVMPKLSGLEVLAALRVNQVDTPVVLMSAHADVDTALKAIEQGAFDYIAKARSTTVLVSAAIGEYVVDETVGNTTVLPSMVLRPDGHDGPTIIGVHPVAPLPSQLANWRADLDWINGICRGEQTILAGDLNATADHFRTIGGDSGGALRLGLGDCLDAGLLTGNGAVGTWPTRLPAILGAPIDHIMVTDDITVTGFRVITTEDGTGSDHRPIVARLLL